VIIPDLRFPNEYEALKEREAYVIRMKRIGHKNSKFFNHASETKVKDIPVHLELFARNNDLSLIYTVAQFLGRKNTERAQDFDYWNYKEVVETRYHELWELCDAVEDGAVEEEMLEDSDRALLQMFLYYQN
jgi:hypothetical protein